MYTRAAHQQLINQKGGKHAKLYKTKHTSMVSQCAVGTNISRGIRLPSAIYEFAILHKNVFSIATLHYSVCSCALKKLVHVNWRRIDIFV